MIVLHRVQVHRIAEPRGTYVRDPFVRTNLLEPHRTELVVRHLACFRFSHSRSAIPVLERRHSGLRAQGEELLRLLAGVGVLDLL